VAVAALTRAALFAFAPVPFGYVYDFYHEGVAWLVQHGRLPPADACWVCAHPPLFFIAGAPFYALATRVAGQRPDVALRLLGVLSLACAAATTLGCYRILRLYRLRGFALLASFAIALVLPCLFISADAPEADILLTALMVAFLERLLRCHLAPARTGWRQAALLGALAGLAMLTKYSGVLALVWALAVFGSRALRGPNRARALRQGLLVACVALAIAGWRYTENYRRHGTVLHAQGSAVSGFALLAPRAHWRDYDFLSLDLGAVGRLYGPEAPQGTLTDMPVYRSVWTSLHALAWSDMSFFSVRGRHGDSSDPYPTKAIPPRLVVAVLALALVPGLLAVVGLACTVRRRAFWPLAFAAASSLAVYLWWFTAQASWALKAKYLLFLLPVYLVHVAVGLRAAHAARPRIVGLVAAGLLIALLVTAEAYLVVFAVA
jgi:4-amino-4-deoxy-L-arabinose transferase-like glycosyltransferase